MPTYEYQCGACGAKFEQFQRMSDDPIKICPQCGESSVKRLMSTGVGVVFKGSGFYVTDYRDASYAKAESADRTNATAPALPQVASSSNDSSSTSKAPSSATFNPASTSSGGNAGGVTKSGVTGGTTASGGTPNTSTNSNSGNASKAA